jgi:hypothetical protein
VRSIVLLFSDVDEKTNPSKGQIASDGRFDRSIIRESRIKGQQQQEGAVIASPVPRMLKTLGVEALRLAW